MFLDDTVSTLLASRSLSYEDEQTLLAIPAQYLLPLPEHVSTNAHTVLANHEDYFVRKHVATHLRATPAVLNHLANDISDNVIEAVAGNRNTSAETLESLIEKPLSRYAAIAVAANSNTNPSTLDRLAAHRWHGVISEVLLNPSTGVATLMKLINTPSAAATIALRNTDLIPAKSRIEAMMEEISQSLRSE